MISLVSFAGIAIFARELGAAGIGVFFLYQTVLNLISIIVDLGLRGAIEKRISEGTIPGPILTTGIAMKSLLLLAVLPVFLVFRDPIISYVGADVGLLLWIGLLAYEFGDTFLRVLRAELRIAETALIELVQKLVWTFGGILMMLSGYGALSLVYAYILSYLVVFLWSAARASTTLSGPNRDAAVSLFSFARHNVVASLGGQVYNWMDTAIIGLFLGAEAVGLYEVAWRLASVVGLLAQSIETTIFPEISALTSIGDTDRVRELIADSLAMSTIFILPAVVGVVVLSAQLLRLLFGPAFVAAQFALTILMLDKLFESYSVIFRRTLMGQDYPQYVSRIISILVVFNVVLNVILVPRIGISGAAVATMTATAISTAGYYYFLARTIEVKFSWFDFGWSAAAAIFMGVTVLTATRTVQTDELGVLFLVLLGVVVYFAVVFLSSSLRKQIMEFASSLS